MAEVTARPVSGILRSRLLRLFSPSEGRGRALEGRDPLARGFQGLIAPRPSSHRLPGLPHPPGPALPGSGWV